MRKPFRTGRVIRGAKRFLLKSGKLPTRMAREHGFVCARIGNMLCAGWYEAYTNGIRLASGQAATWGRRVAGLPPRFTALFLLYRLRKMAAPGTLCRSLA